MGSCGGAGGGPIGGIWGSYRVLWGGGLWGPVGGGVSMGGYGVPMGVYGVLIGSCMGGSMGGYGIPMGLYGVLIGSCRGWGGLWGPVGGRGGPMG